MTEKEINIDEILDEIRGDTIWHKVSAQCEDCIKLNACKSTGSAYTNHAGNCNRHEVKY